MYFSLSVSLAASDFNTIDYSISISRRLKSSNRIDHIAGGESESKPWYFCEVVTDHGYSLIKTKKYEFFCRTATTYKDLET